MSKLQLVTIDHHTITFDPVRRLVSEEILEVYGDAAFNLGYTYGREAFEVVDNIRFIKETYLKAYCIHSGYDYINVFNYADKPVVVANTPELMSSLEIAQLTGKLHKNVMRDIRDMVQQIEENTSGSKLSYMVISDTYDAKAGFGTQKAEMYKLDRDTTYTLLLGYDAAARFKVVKRWQELEHKLVTPVAQAPVVPNNLPDALRLAATLVEERDEAIKSRSLISSQREASVMGKLGQATLEIKRLKAKLEEANTIAYVSRPTGRYRGV